MNILLHTCCSNCSILPFRLIKAEGHKFTGLWFNPNIHPLEEYSLRLDSLKRLSSLTSVDMLFLEDYRPEDYFRMLGLEDEFPESDEEVDPETAPGSPERCRACYELRLGKTAEEALKNGFDAFSSTLLISPYQDFEQLKSTGMEMAEKHNIEFYMMDFRPFFRDSMDAARDMDLYRQKYCGCIFSKKERELKNKGTKTQRHKV